MIHAQTFTGNYLSDCVARSDRLFIKLVTPIIGRITVDYFYNKCII